MRGMKIPVQDFARKMQGGAYPRGRCICRNIVQYYVPFKYGSIWILKMEADFQVFPQ